jgi:hypothetical protein
MLQLLLMAISYLVLWLGLSFDAAAQLSIQEAMTIILILHLTCNSWISVSVENSNTFANGILASHCFLIVFGIL